MISPYTTFDNSSRIDRPLQWGIIALPFSLGPGDTNSCLRRAGPIGTISSFVDRSVLNVPTGNANFALAPSC